MNEQQILEQCLAQMAMGTAIEECLSAYPDQAADLRPLLLAAQRLQGASAITMPDASRMVTRQRLLNRMDALPPAPVPVSNRRQDWRERLGLALTPVFAPAMARTLALALVVITGLLLSGFAVEAALPGDRLYAAKLAGEKVVLALSPNPTDMRLALAQRRLHEIVSLQEKDRHQDVPAALAGYQQLMAVWENTDALIESRDRQAAEERMRAQVRFLQTLEASAPAQQQTLFGEQQRTTQALIDSLVPPPTLIAPTPTPTATAISTATPSPTPTPRPSSGGGEQRDMTSPTSTAVATDEARPSPIAPTDRPKNTPPPTRTPDPNRTPPPTRTPDPDRTPPPTRTPDPNRTPPLTRTPDPNRTPPPTRTPDPDRTPPPTRTPYPERPPPPTRTPDPDRTPLPVRTPDPDRPPPLVHTPDPDRPPSPGHTPNPDRTPRVRGG